MGDLFMSEMMTVSRRGAWVLALVATFTMVVSYLDRQVLAVLSNEICHDLHIDETHYGFLASAFSIAYLVGTPLAGKWLDAIGVRRGLLIAVCAWTVVSAFHSLAFTFAAMFGMRILLGFAESPSFPGSAQTISRTMPVKERPRALGILFAGSPIGAIIAAPLSAVIAAHYGWRASFLGVAAIGAIWIPVWLFAAWRNPARDLLDLRAHAQTPQAKLSLPALLREKAVYRAMILVVGVAPTAGFLLLWGAKFMRHEFHATLQQLGALLIIPSLCFDIGSISFGDLAARRRKKFSNHDGKADSALLITGMLLVSCVGFLSFTQSPLQAALVMGVALAGAGGLFAMLTSDMLTRISPSLSARAAGFTAASQSLAYIIANPLIGKSVDAFSNYRVATFALAAAAIPACVAWLLIANHASTAAAATITPPPEVLPEARHEGTS